MEPHFSGSHIFHGATFFMEPHFSWTHIFHGATFSIEPHFSWSHIFHRATFFIEPHFSWSHILHGAISFVESHFLWSHIFMEPRFLGQHFYYLEPHIFYVTQLDPYFHPLISIEGSILFSRIRIFQQN